MNRPRAIRGGTVAVASSVWLLFLGGTAWAHPVTGGPSSALQVTVVAVGGLLILAGALAVVYGDKLGKLGALRHKVGLPVLFVGLLAFTVGPSVVSGVDDDDPCEGRPSTDMSLEVVRPGEGEVFNSNMVPFEVGVVGGRFAEETTLQNRPGEGHLHIAVDGRIISMNGEDSGEIHLASGTHVLTFDLSANDHSPFCPQVQETRTVKVEL